MNKAVVFEGYYLHTQKGTKVCAIWPAVSLCQTRKRLPIWLQLSRVNVQKTAVKPLLLKILKAAHGWQP